jgi:glycosyltransferase involved in cell wall biosynthesis
MHELKARGWEVGMGIPAWDVARGFGIRYDQQTVISGWDVVVLKLLMQRDTPHQVLQARKVQKVIVDVDDFYAGLTPDNQAHRVTDPDFNPDRNRDHYERVIEAADVVVTSTPFLRDWYMQRHPNVQLVRNGVDFARYTRVKDRAGWKPTLGWVGGIPWRSGDLETLAEWLPGFIAEHDLRVHHSGHLDKRPERFWSKTGVPEHLVSTYPMRPILDYPNLFSGFEVGLVPLTDIPFNHAKSTIKGLEYAAAGIPFVAAATPEYVRLAELGIGRVASTAEEWVKHLTDLLDPAVRKREAARQRALVSQEFSITQRGQEWHAILSEVVTTP